MGNSSTLLFLLLLPLQQNGPTSVVLQADALRDAHKEEAALDLYETVLETEPTHLDALVQASWLAGQLSTYRPDGKQRIALCSQALTLAQRAYALAPDHAEVNLVMAAATGHVGLMAGIRQRVQAALDVKGFLDRAVAGNPDDARAWYILGRWSYRIASASALEKAGARMVGAQLPDVSMEEARDAYRKAVELNPDSILYRWDFAQALEATGDTEEAVKQLARASEIDPKTPRDPGLLAQLRYRLKKLTKN